LEDWGIRVLVAPGFADIFYNNCFKNGMLPIVLSEAQVDDLFARAAAHLGYTLTADLDTCTLSDAHGLVLPFEVEEFRRTCLLNGLDDIGLTLEHHDKIAAYERGQGYGG
jgi:3-isopropylmalate/(R)-2-methylmalate dehydratase small subunit